ncbi:hypothetical protein [Burkholderia ubonensis]|uniref:hypothetical protein n=1 Tax=Burkholderia ubonensis TaxID=101571 RepID=UPI001160F3E4|nr:hypothetical protein [Burkholderia ubonensis]
MSDNERDVRLGLKGLTPERREERIRALQRELTGRQAQARRNLDKKRQEARRTLLGLAMDPPREGGRDGMEALKKSCMKVLHIVDRCDALVVPDPLRSIAGLENGEENRRSKLTMPSV